MQDNSEIVSRVCERFRATLQIYNCSDSVRSLLKGRFHSCSDVTIHTESNNVDGLHCGTDAWERASRRRIGTYILLHPVQTLGTPSTLKMKLDERTYQFVGFGSEDVHDSEPLGV
jgi:hypothetical protein